MKAKAFLKPAVLAVSCVFVVCFAYFCLYIPYAQLRAFRHVEVREIEGSWELVGRTSDQVILKGLLEIHNPTSTTVRIDGAEFTIYGVLRGERYYIGEGEIKEEVTIPPEGSALVTVYNRLEIYKPWDYPEIEFVGTAYRHTALGILKTRFDILWQP